MQGVGNDGRLVIEFCPCDGVVSLRFQFLGYAFSAPVATEQARYLFRKLGSSSHWQRSESRPNELSAVGSDKLMVCKRCGGRGDIPMFKHVQEGICFLCWGSGGRWGTEDSGGAIHDFSIVCKGEELGGLYGQLQKAMQECARKRANAPAEAEMQRIRERRRARALEKEKASQSEKKARQE
jgi:hypothetical protein